MILIGAQHLQCLVFIISYCVIAYQLVSHRNVQQFRCYLMPIEYLIIIEVCPMELEFFSKALFFAWICKVERFLRCHSYKHLNQRKYALTKHALVHIAFYLPYGI